MFPGLYGVARVAVPVGVGCAHPGPTALYTGTAMFTYRDFAPKPLRKVFKRACDFPLGLVAVPRTICVDRYLMRQDCKGLTARPVCTRKHHGENPRLLPRQGPTGRRAIADTVGIAWCHFKRLRARGIGTEQLHTGNTMGWHQVTSYLVRGMCVRPSRVIGHTRLTDHPHRDRLGGCATPPNPKSISHMLLKLKE